MPEFSGPWTDQFPREGDGVKSKNCQCLGLNSRLPLVSGHPSSKVFSPIFMCNMYVTVMRSMYSSICQQLTPAKSSKIHVILENHIATTTSPYTVPPRFASYASRHHCKERGDFWPHWCPPVPFHWHQPTQQVPASRSAADAACHQLICNSVDSLQKEMSLNLTTVGSLVDHNVLGGNLVHTQSL